MFNLEEISINEDYQAAFFLVGLFSSQQYIVSLIIGLSLLFGHAELRDDVDLDGLVLTDLAKPGAKLACQNSNYPKNSGPSHLQH